MAHFCKLILPGASFDSFLGNRDNSLQEKVSFYLKKAAKLATAEAGEGGGEKKKKVVVAEEEVEEAATVHVLANIIVSRETICLHCWANARAVI